MENNNKLELAVANFKNAKKQKINVYKISSNDFFDIIEKRKKEARYELERLYR